MFKNTIDFFENFILTRTVGGGHNYVVPTDSEFGCYALNASAALGFTEIGRRPNYYFHPKEDARILRKDLTA